MPTEARLRIDPPPPAQPHQGLFDWLDAKHRGLLEWLVANEPQTLIGMSPLLGQQGQAYQAGPMAGGRIRKPRQRLDDPRLRRWLEMQIAPGSEQRMWQYEADPADRWRAVQDAPERMR